MYQPDKARLTLNDNSTILLSTDLIESVEQSMGEVRNIFDICGIHPLFGPSYCSECKAKNNLEGCGKWFVVSTQRGEPEPIMVNLKDGGTLYVKDFELIQDGNTEQYQS